MSTRRGIQVFRLLQLVLVCVGAQACLSSSYQISPQELRRLTTIAPERRGESVHVVQQTKAGNDRQRAETEPPPSEPQAAVIIASQRRYYGSGSSRYRYVRGPGFEVESVSTDYDDDDYDDDDDSNNDGNDGAALALGAVIAVTAIAGGAAIVASAIEGSRFDGYANIASDHPVLVFSNAGQRYWKPLYQLKKEDALLSKYAVVSKRDGFIDELERAPLDRVGFGYQFEAGAARLTTPYGASNPGFSIRTALGYSPWQQVGFYWGGQFVAGDAQLASMNEAFALDLRTFAQVEYWPIGLGRFHAGIFGEVGVGQQLLDEAVGTRSLVTPSFGAGLALQLEVTTRLAVTLRGSAMMWPGGAVPLEKTITPALTLGVAVY